MTHPIPSEMIEYERYVDGLRRSNKALIAVLKDIISAADETPFNSIGHVIEHGRGSTARAVVAQAIGESPPAPAKIITIHVEGGLVQDVTGIPRGCEVRVEDYDHADDTQLTWDEENECHVTVYGGDDVSDSTAQTPMNAVELAEFMALPSEILQLAEIDADDGDLALQTLSEIRALARAAEAKVQDLSVRCGDTNISG